MRVRRGPGPARFGPADERHLHAPESATAPGHEHRNPARPHDASRSPLVGQSSDIMRRSERPRRLVFASTVGGGAPGLCRAFFSRHDHAVRTPDAAFRASASRYSGEVPRRGNPLPVCASSGLLRSEVSSLKARAWSMFSRIVPGQAAPLTPAKANSLLTWLVGEHGPCRRPNRCLLHARSDRERTQGGERRPHQGRSSDLGRRSLGRVVDRTKTVLPA